MTWMLLGTPKTMGIRITDFPQPPLKRPWYTPVLHHRIVRLILPRHVHQAQRSITNAQIVQTALRAAGDAQIYHASGALGHVMPRGPGDMSKQMETPRRMRSCFAIVPMILI